MLLDKDSLDESSGCNINRKSLEEAKFDKNFLRDNCFFIGTKEFEDTYTDAQLAKMANIYLQKKSGKVWAESDFSSIRNSAKFSKDLTSLFCREVKQNVTKPVIASYMAKTLTKDDIINNTTLKKCFDKILEISNGD